MDTYLTREESVPKYFITTPKKYSLVLKMLYFSIPSLIIGLILMVNGMSTDNTSIGLIGLFLTGFGAIGTPVSYGYRSQYEKAFRRAEPKPSDEQMDEWLNESVMRIKKQGIEKLDLNPDQIVSDPLVIIGPSFRSTVAVGTDHILRFSRYDIVVIFLTNYHLAAYEVELDLATDREVKESTQEYHYADVVAVSTITQSDFVLVYEAPVKAGTQGRSVEHELILGSKKFALSVASGERIDVTISFINSDQLTEVDPSFKYARLPESEADKAIKVIRAQLREKKGGTYV